MENSVAAGCPKNPRRSEIALFALLVLFFVFFADLVQVRSAFLSRVMGDADVFFRAGWAVRTGRNIYEVSDPNNWHYNYPPLFAILMAPLGDPAPGEARAGFLPYPVSVSILYKISLLSLIGGVLFLVNAVRCGCPDLFQNDVCRRGYYLGFVGILVCLSPIAHTLMRGQVNLFLLALICLAIGCQIQGRSFWSGIFIALSICLKVFPAFLLIIPVWRKDFWQASGVVFGLVLGLILVPVIAFGPEKTIVAYQDFYKVLLGPALGLSGDNSRDVELNAMNSTDNHSILAFLHGIEFPDHSKKPAKPGSMTKVIHLVMSALLLGWLLWVKGKPKKGTSLGDSFFFSLAALLMLFVCPVSHSQYFCLALPLIVCLHVYSWKKDPEKLFATSFVLVILGYMLLSALPLLPLFESWKRMGIIFIPNMLLFVYAIVMFGRIQSEDQSPG